MLAPEEKHHPGSVNLPLAELPKPFQAVCGGTVWRPDHRLGWRSLEHRFQKELVLNTGKESILLVGVITDDFKAIK